MVWIIIAVVVIAVLGPVLALVPSRRDRLLAGLRTAARRAELVVEVTSVPKLDAAAEERVSAGGAPRDARIDCAAYRLPLSAPLPNAPRWLLLKSGRDNRYLDGWATLHPPRQLPTPVGDYWHRIGAILDALPGGCVGVEADPGRVTWFGLERSGGVAVEAVAAGIRDGLAAIEALHQALEEAAADHAK